MRRPLHAAASASLWISGASVAAQDELVVAVNYRHADLHVHYNLRCADSAPCWLESQPGAEPSWRITITPTQMNDGTVRLAAEVQENRQVSARGTVVVETGVPATISSQENADSALLTLEALR